MSGQAATFGQGTLVASGGTIILAGQQIAGSTGTLNANQHGQQFFGQQGSATVSLTLALAGIAITAAAGTASPNQGQLTLSGQPVSVAQGNVSANGAPVTVNITGEDFATSAGTIIVGGQLLSGASSPGSAGTAAANSTLPISGTQFASASGTLAPSQTPDDTFIEGDQGSPGITATVALGGASSTSAQGTLTVTADASLPLTGSGASFATGTPVAGPQVPLVGSVITGAQANIGAPGGASLTGSQFAAVDGVVYVTPDRTFPITGSEIDSATGITFASSLAFPPGQALTIAQGHIGPITLPLVGQAILSGTGLVTPPPQQGGAGDYGHGKKKKRYVVRIRDELREFESEAAAKAALTNEATEAQKAVPLAEIKAKVSNADELLAQERLEELLAIFEEEQEIEALLLSL